MSKIKTGFVQLNPFGFLSQIRNLNGFTIIELLVVLSIISFMMSIAYINLPSVQARSQDTKIMKQIDAVQNALASYKQDNGYYPAALTPGQPLVGPGGKVYLDEIEILALNNDSCEVNGFTYAAVDSGNYELKYCLNMPLARAETNNCVANAGDLCVACVPQCNGKYCGWSDGCGGTCGAAGCDCMDNPQLAAVTDTVVTEYNDYGHGRLELTWGAVPGASSYDVCYHVEGSGSQCHVDFVVAENTTDTSMTLDNLTPAPGDVAVRARSCGDQAVGAVVASSVRGGSVFSAPEECPAGVCGDGTSLSCGSADFSLNGSLTLNSSNASAYANEVTYQAVRVGDQCWLSKNIGRMGVEKATVSDYDPNGEYLIHACYANTTANCDTDGALYSWITANYLPRDYYNDSGVLSKYLAFYGPEYTVSNTGIDYHRDASDKRQGICPKGWHLPSDYELGVLEYYLDESNPKITPPTGYCGAYTWGYYASNHSCLHSQGLYRGTSTYGTNITNKMSCTTFTDGTWQNCGITNLNIPRAGNQSEFTGNFGGRGAYGHLWTSNWYSFDRARFRTLGYVGIDGLPNKAYRGDYTKMNNGFHVRCIKD